MQNAYPASIEGMEAAFAGECMAHIRHLWLAERCRNEGDEAAARAFEAAAAREMRHALGHAARLFSGGAVSREAVRAGKRPAVGEIEARALADRFPPPVRAGKGCAVPAKADAGQANRGWALLKQMAA